MNRFYVQGKKGDDVSFFDVTDIPKLQPYFLSQQSINDHFTAQLLKYKDREDRLELLIPIIYSVPEKKLRKLNGILKKKFVTHTFEGTINLFLSKTGYPVISIVYIKEEENE